MNEMDDRLNQLFALDEPRVSSPRFVAEVMEDVARRRFYRDLQTLCLATFVISMVLAAIWPQIQPGLDALTAALGPILFALSILVSGVILTGRRGLSMLGLET